MEQEMTSMMNIRGMQTRASRKAVMAIQIGDPEDYRIH
jgi:hypothetical protein